MPITPPPLRVLKPIARTGIDASHKSTAAKVSARDAPAATCDTRHETNPWLRQGEAWSTRLWRRRGRLPRMIAVRAVIGAGALGLQSVAGESLNTALAAMGLGTVAELLRSATAWLPWSGTNQPY